MNRFFAGIKTVLLVLMLILSFYVIQGVQAKVPDQKELNSIKLARKDAVHRKRRIIFNNDGDDVTSYAKKATPESLLDTRTTGLVGTQVDTIVYNTAYCFGNVLHRTKVGTTFTCKEGLFSNNKVEDFLEQGTDSLQIIVDFCRKNNIEVFWSMRMNDIHDGQTSETAALMLPKFKKDHPELLMGSKDNPPKIDYWTSVDYSHQEIRDMAFKFIQEVCENYDVDGVNLDFFRHMPFFKSVAMGQSATQEDLGKMTDLMCHIRQMADKVGAKRGRPILIAVRVPDSVGYCNASGFDIVRWMEQDLIDILVVTGYFRLNPWEVSVELGHKYGIPVYPSLDEGRWLDEEASAIRNSMECLRGRAAIAWHSGADGICTFNFWGTDGQLKAENISICNEIGEQRTLMAVDKVYTTGARSLDSANRFLAGGDRFINRSILSPEQPKKLKPGESTNVELCVAENVQEARRQGAVPNFKLLLRFDKQINVEEISVRLSNDLLYNDGSRSGVWAKHPASLDGIVPPSIDSKSSVWVEYAVNPDRLKQGVNSVAITLKSESNAELILQDILLLVRYHNSEHASAVSN
ncbi:MAG: glycoside hydrolase family 10 protein [Sedimentisphaerales bacterium]